MEILNNVSLKDFNTFGIDVQASKYCNIVSVDVLKEVLSHHTNEDIFILSGGSNILLTKDINALVLHINPFKINMKY